LIAKEEREAALRAFARLGLVQLAV
jgi:hypothetical protein